MKENVTIFTKSAISFFSIWRVCGSFSNKIIRKVVTENLNCYFIMQRIFSSKNVFFFVLFLFFHLILNFSNYKEKDKILIFFKKKTFFALFCRKFEKYENRLKNKKSVPRHGSLCDFPKIWAFSTQRYFYSLSQKFWAKKVIFCDFLKKISIFGDIW